MKLLFILLFSVVVVVLVGCNRFVELVVLVVLFIEVVVVKILLLEYLIELVC